MSYSLCIRNSSADANDLDALVSILTANLDLQKSTASLLVGKQPCRVYGIKSVAELDSVIRELDGLGIAYEIAEEHGSSGQQDQQTEEEFTAEDLKGFVDYYRLLDVDPGVSNSTIKKAYKSKSKKYHPDRYQKSERLSFYVEMQKSLNIAYETLSDPEKRQQYDRKRQQYSSSGSEAWTIRQRAEREYHVALGYLDGGHLETAIENLQKCIYLDDDFIDAKLLLADLWFEKRSFEEARKVSRELVDGSYAADAYVILAQCDIIDPKRGSMDRAVRYCEQAIKSNPHFTPAYQVKAEALRTANRTREGIDFLKGTIRQGHDGPHVRLTLSNLYLDVHEIGLATKNVEVLLNQVPEHVAENITKDFNRARDSVLDKVNQPVSSGEDQNGLGCLFWMAVVGGTIAPPHFWGILLLIGGLGMKYASRRSKKNKESMRDRKGIRDPGAELSQKLCNRCDFYQGDEYHCSKIKTTVRANKFPDKDMKCGGKFYISYVDGP